ncbi:E3 SUMO-protein ligase ZBED1-like, partial [Frankliniella occidentalis]|uniref:E3 SUMO-protein ligase ZBED1-like n=1 Tax=Frankliniella occidentalis TaxID=133901 RepID=A0A9C6XVR2_FRAOC
GSEDDPGLPGPSSAAAPAAAAASGAPAAGASGGSRKRSSSSSCTTPNTPKQMTLSRSFEAASSLKDPDGMRNLALREALLYMICRDNMPLQTSDKEGFRNFCKVAVPLWKPPSRGTVTTLLEEKYLKCSAFVRDTIAELDAYCMTADIWTEKHTVKSYLGVTLHFFDSKSNAMDSFRLGLVPLAGAHTAAYVGEHLNSVCSEWGIIKERVQLFVTDNAENMKKVVNDNFRAGTWQPCFAHTLNLCADAPFKKVKDRNGVVKDAVPGLDALIAKAKKIVTYTKHSVKTTDEMRRIQMEDYNRSEGTCLKLQQDVATRWNSTYLMLDRFLEMSDIVSAALLKAKDAPDMLSGAEMFTYRSLLKIFRPFYQITLELSGHKVPTASKVVPLIHLANEALSRVDPGTDAIAKGTRDVLLGAMKHYFENIERVKPYIMATFLDPRFKDMHFSTIVKSSEVISLVERELKEVLRGEKNRREAEVLAMQAGAREEVTTDPDNLWALHDSAAASRTSYGEDETVGLPLQLREYKRKSVLSREGDPFQQWAVLKEDTPELYTVALRYLDSYLFLSRLGVILLPRGLNRLTQAKPADSSPSRNDCFPRFLRH